MEYETPSTMVIRLGDTPDSLEEMQKCIDMLIADGRQGKHKVVITLVGGGTPLDLGKTTLLEKIVDSIRANSSPTLFFFCDLPKKTETRGSFLRVESAFDCPSHERFSQRPKGDERQMEKLEKLARKQQNKQQRSHQRRC
jgi:hypothetical protein